MKIALSIAAFIALAIPLSVPAQNKPKVFFLDRLLDRDIWPHLAMAQTQHDKALKPFETTCAEVTIVTQESSADYVVVWRRSTTEVGVVSIYHQTPHRESEASNPVEEWTAFNGMTDAMAKTVCQGILRDARKPLP